MRVFATVALAAALLTPCAAIADDDGSNSVASNAISSVTGWTDRLAKAWISEPLNVARNWQCVTFARFLSGIQIFGDAWTWWDKADGKYARGSKPDLGSVLVFQRKGNMSRGHVAVVSQVLTDRVISITHANWSPINGRRGQVEEDVTVVDVSDGNDWSKVKVWYGPQEDLGGSVYPVYGFIYQPDGKATVGDELLADAGDKAGDLLGSVGWRGGSTAAR